MISSEINKINRPKPVTVFVSNNIKSISNKTFDKQKGGSTNIEEIFRKKESVMLSDTIDSDENSQNDLLNSRNNFKLPNKYISEQVLPTNTPSNTQNIGIKKKYEFSLNKNNNTTLSSHITNNDITTLKKNYKSNIEISQNMNNSSKRSMMTSTTINTLGNKSNFDIIHRRNSENQKLDNMGNQEDKDEIEKNPYETSRSTVDEGNIKAINEEININKNDKDELIYSKNLDNSIIIKDTNVIHTISNFSINNDDVIRSTAKTPAEIERKRSYVIDVPSSLIDYRQSSYVNYYNRITDNKESTNNINPQLETQNKNEKNNLKEDSLNDFLELMDE